MESPFSVSPKDVHSAYRISDSILRTTGTMYIHDTVTASVEEPMDGRAAACPPPTGKEIADLADPSGEQRYEMKMQKLREKFETPPPAQTVAEARLREILSTNGLKSYIINLLGRPIMTEEERLYRKIQRRRPKMLKLASSKGLLCE